MARITFELWNYSSIRPATIKDGSAALSGGSRAEFDIAVRQDSKPQPDTAAAVHLSAFATLPLVFAANIQRAQFVYLQAAGGGGGACCNYENG